MQQIEKDADEEDINDLEELILESKKQKGSLALTVLILALAPISVFQQILIFAGPHRVLSWAQKL